MDYKSETKRAYDVYGEDLSKKYAVHSKREAVQNAALEFIQRLSGKKVLDVGCGPGIHAEWFVKQGLEVLCVDLSEKMVALAKAAGLNARQGDFEKLDFPPQSFDGIWAYASLIHVPKEKTPKVIDKFSQLLKPNGLLATSVKEGQGQGFEENEKYPGVKRWFSYYTDKEFRSLCEKNFELLRNVRTQVQNGPTFLDCLYKLKS